MVPSFAPASSSIPTRVISAAVPCCARLILKTVMAANNMTAKAKKTVYFSFLIYLNVT
jgi:hypothetical protein